MSGNTASLLKNGSGAMVDSDPRMTILITGGASYIGSHMLLALLEAGEDVLVLDDLSTGFQWAVRPQAKFVKGSVGDKELVQPLMNENRIQPRSCVEEFASTMRRFSVSRCFDIIESDDCPAPGQSKAMALPCRGLEQPRYLHGFRKASKQPRPNLEH